MQEKKQVDRRGFLKTSTLGVIGAGAVGTGLLRADDKKQGKPTGKEEKPKFPKIKEYRMLGRTGFKVSDISLGTSRSYPIPVLQACLDAGVNYIDTAEGYGRGASETSIGKAIQGYDRKKLFITSKLHISEDTPKDEIISRFGKSLERLQTPYIDCLLMHGPSSEKVLKNPGFHAAADQLKKEGKLKFTGASSHGARHGRGADMEEVLMAAINDGRFDVLLVVYNFVQKDQGERLFAAAKKKNVGITIMKSNPVGRYFQMKERVDKMKAEGKEVDDRTKNYFARLQEAMDKSAGFLKKHKLENPADIRNAAVKFVLNHPGIHSLCLAFRSFDDIDAYLSLSGSRLTPGDKKAMTLFHEGCGQLYCRHACGICESGCPHNVPVNTIMRYNHYFEANESEKYAMEKYAALSSAKADKCLACPGFCESSCPHGVPVKGLLSLAHDQLTLC